MNSDTSLEKELNMIDLNIKAVHTLTKLYLKDMVESSPLLHLWVLAQWQPLAQHTHIHRKVEDTV